MEKILLAHKCLKFERHNFIAEGKKKSKSLRKLWQSCDLSAGLRFHSQASGVPRREYQRPSLVNSCVHPFLTALLCHPSIQQLLLEHQRPGIVGGVEKWWMGYGTLPVTKETSACWWSKALTRGKSDHHTLFKKKVYWLNFSFAVLGLHCCTQASSPCAERGYAF